MKTKKGNEFDPRSQWWTYEVNGKEYEWFGEMSYNREKDRFEHIHIGPRGGEILIVWYRNKKR